MNRKLQQKLDTLSAIFNRYGFKHESITDLSNEDQKKIKKSYNDKEEFLKALLTIQNRRNTRGATI